MANLTPTLTSAPTLGGYDQDFGGLRLTERAVSDATSITSTFRLALPRVWPIDLHKAAFPVDAAAQTVMEHIGAMVVREAPDSFTLLSASSSAGSFLHAVETSVRYIQ